MVSINGMRMTIESKKQRIINYKIVKFFKWN